MCVVIEVELLSFVLVMVCARFHFWEVGLVEVIVDVLVRIWGSYGVVFKVQDEFVVAEVVDALVALGVPVVIYSIDVPTSARVGYVGIDNHGAGMTAAYLMDQWLGDAPSDVLITLSCTVFRGEGEREVGFRVGLWGSGRAIVEVSDSDGIDVINEVLVFEVVWCVVGSVVFNKCGGGGQWVRVILGPDPHIPL